MTSAAPATQPPPKHSNVSGQGVSFKLLCSAREIIAERHQLGSIIVISNRPPGDWLSLFPDQVMANSAMDRLAHRAHHVAMKGDSYRKKTRPKKQSLEQ